ncbi:facilitated trehalose transporter Tret1-like isoform X1 [Trichoplusia ni]|uniref:Facilitated trehalose transporter Tret1-like isoform X1 n=1 Tax=Trichoplusia ni TaxID=7111 RepID=A0A7E5VSC2_TRINI|nr:facilitated trehalose transporter Tret1-like isoform X1 [Trichoplusia ni]
MISGVMPNYFVFQTWTMSAVLINMFGQGMVLSYTSSLLPGLNHPDSPIKIDLNTGSWLGSIVGVSGIPGFLLSSVLMDRLGRKATHFIIVLPGVVGWLLIYFANNVKAIMIGRFLGGLSSLGTVSLGAVVIGEYTCPKYRGVFLYLKNAAVCLGAMFTHIISRFLHWRTITLVGLIPMLIALTIIYTWPESPAWLISRKQYDRSKEAFLWLRGDSEASKKELAETINAQKERMRTANRKITLSFLIKDFFRKFTRKDFVKPLNIMILAALVLEMSGRHVFPAYAPLIMAAITGESTQSFYYTLALDLIITVASLFASILVKLMSRRKLLFTTGFSAFGVLTLVCLNLFLTSQDIIANRPLTSVSMLVVYFIFANLGCAPIPLALAGEVFPLAHRGVGSAVTGLWISVCLIIGLKSTPHLIVSISVSGFFAVYGLVMGTSLVILYFVMPETKDKTLQEIENFFNHGTFTVLDIVEEAEELEMIRK